MASKEFDGNKEHEGEAQILLSLSPYEAFIVRKALKKFSKLAITNQQSSIADHILEVMEKDDE